MNARHYEMLVSIFTLAFLLLIVIASCRADFSPIPTSIGSKKVGQQRSAEALTADDRNPLNRQSWFDLYVAFGPGTWANWALTIVAIGAGLIAKRTLRANMIQARAATDAAKSATTTLTVSQRAYLDVTFDQPPSVWVGHRVKTTFNVVNAGPTRAYIKRISVKSFIGPDLPDFNIEPVPVGNLPTQVIVPGKGSRPSEHHSDFALSSAQGQQLTDQTVKYTVYGSVFYDDIFGVRHFTRFCQVFSPKMDRDRGGFVYPLNAKAEYNDAD